MAASGVADDGRWLPEFPGQRRPFEAGNLASVRHGAFSQRVTGPLADAIAAEQLGRADCPAYLREPSYAAAVQAWAQAEAEVRKLRERRDELERLADGDAAGAVDETLSDVTVTEEDETRPAMGQVRRVSVTRQQESLARALHRAEMRARTLRSDLGLSPLSRARLGRDVASQRFDMALVWAQQDDSERQRD